MESLTAVVKGEQREHKGPYRQKANRCPSICHCWVAARDSEDRISAWLEDVVHTHGIDWTGDTVRGRKESVLEAVHGCRD